jgi:hypothetical protein
MIVLTKATERRTYRGELQVCHKLPKDIPVTVGELPMTDDTMRTCPLCHNFSTRPVLTNALVL